MLVTFLIFASTIIVGLLSILIYFSPRSGRRISTVPGLDPSDNLEGNLQDISSAGSLHEFLVDLHDKFGPVASFWFGQEFCISVSNPFTFKEIQSLFDRPKLFFEALIPIISSKSIQLTNGIEAKERHKRLSEALGHYVCVEKLSQFIQMTNELSKSWKTFDNEEHIPLCEYMIALSIRMVSETQFGAYFQKSENIKNVAHLYHDIIKGYDDITSGKLSSKKEDDKVKYEHFESACESLKTELKKLIKHHEKAKEEGNNCSAPLLDTLLENHDDDEELMVGDVITLFIGGFHTTGNLLSWLFYFLAIHPDIQEKVHEELTVQLDGDKELNAEDIPKLRYSSQVIEETLRLSITAPYAARISSQELSILGHKIPANTPIIASLGVSLHDEKYFPNPQDFDPERFSVENIKKRPSLAYMPFGLGSRRCPGYRFSRFEAFATLSVLVRQFRIRPAFEDDFFIQPSFGFVTKPDTEIWIKVESRL